jgi:hypothetical protein
MLYTEEQHRARRSRGEVDPNCYAQERGNCAEHDSEADGLRNRKVPTCQRPLALFRVEAISFSIRNIVEYIREARQGAKCDQRDRGQNRITRVKKPVAEDEGCEDQSVFDPFPWAREHDQCEARAAFRGASDRRRIDDARSRHTGWSCAAISLRKCRARARTAPSDRWPVESRERTRHRANSSSATKNLQAVPGTRTAPARGHLARQELRP